MSPSAALALCRAHPAERYLLSVGGWFVPSAEGARFVEGGLFDSREALPLVTVNDWATNGNWRRYGAIDAYIGTQASFGPPTVTLHGRLDCATARLVTDRDPFPPPPLRIAYEALRVAASGATTTSATAGGLRLTLTVPRRSYPRLALAQVRVSLRNVTDHNVGVWTPGVGPVGYAAPQAEVLDAQGKVLFPPAMPSMPALPGPPPFLRPLHPGGAISLDEYIMVRGEHVRASVQFEPDTAGSMHRPSRTFTTHPIVLRLTSERPPVLTLGGNPADPSLEVTRPAGVSGPMLRLSYADCGNGSSGPIYAYTGAWVTSGLHLTPGCSPLEGWHVRVAWLNHPVAALDYLPPHPTPLPGPTPSPTPAATATPSGPPSPGFGELLARANRAVASLHSMHATGIRTAVDPSARMSLRITADCASQAGGALPVRLRTLISGSGTQVGRIDEGYTIVGPVLAGSPTTVRARHRSLATHEAWQAVDLHAQAGWGIARDPAFDPNPAYVNQVCPDVLRLTYLAAPLPSARSGVLGTEELDGRRVWHLREEVWFKADLYVDASTFRLRRLLLWDGAAHAASRWRVRFDYGRFGEAVKVGR